MTPKKPKTKYHSKLYSKRFCPCGGIAVTQIGMIGSCQRCNDWDRKALSLKKPRETRRLNAEGGFTEYKQHAVKI